METLVMYAFLILCAITLWKCRDRIEVWLLFGIASIGCLSLAYVVVNVSALYRMRYAYFIIVIILGMKGLLSVPGVRARRGSSPTVREGLKAQKKATPDGRTTAPAFPTQH
jgi:hypothetical protein